MERYRSGHNGTDSKSVVRQRTVGSNPTRSAILIIGMWLSLVEHYVRDVGAAGSNPVIPTNKKGISHSGVPFFYYLGMAKDLNLKKARSVKKSCRWQVFSERGAQTGTEMRSIWVVKQARRATAVSCHPDPCLADISVI